MSYEYRLRIEADDECVATYEDALHERQVIESPAGVLIVEAIEAEPSEGAPGTAACRRFTPVHST